MLPFDCIKSELIFGGVWTRKPTTPCTRPSWISFPRRPKALVSRPRPILWFTRSTTRLFRRLSACSPGKESSVCTRRSCSWPVSSCATSSQAYPLRSCSRIFLVWIEYSRYVRDKWRVLNWDLWRRALVSALLGYLLGARERRVGSWGRPVCQTGVPVPITRDDDKVD